MFKRSLSFRPTSRRAWLGLLLLLSFPLSLGGQTVAETEMAAEEPVTQEPAASTDALLPVQPEPQSMPLPVTPEPVGPEAPLPPPVLAAPGDTSLATEGVVPIGIPEGEGSLDAIEDTEMDRVESEGVGVVPEPEPAAADADGQLDVPATLVGEEWAAEAADTGSEDSEARVTDAITELRISGASTIQPIIEALRDEFERETGVRLLVTGGGSGRGISDVMEGVSAVGMVSRSLRDSEQAELRQATIALDTLVFVVNAANPRHNITRSDLVALYTRAEDWSQFAEGFDWPLHRVSKEVGRSTLDLFEEFTGLTSPDRPGATGTLINRRSVVIGSNLEVATLVGGLRGGVGYLSLGSAASLRDQGLPIRVLDLGGVTPSVRTIESGQYPIRRELNLVYLEPNPATDALLALLGSATGRQVIESAGFIATGGQ